MTENTPAGASAKSAPGGGRAWRWVKRIAITLLVIIASVGLFIAYWLWGPVVTSDELAGLSKSNTLGPVDAPVKVVEFSDFGCPACRRWHRAGIRAQIMDMFGDRVSFTYRHFPVISEHGTDAAIAAECAGKQGAFWEYHNHLFEKATSLAPPALLDYAVELGLDSQAFEACVRSDETREYVSRDERSAIREGARGTPAFFVNGRLVHNPGLEQLATLVRDAGG